MEKLQPSEGALTGQPITRHDGAREDLAAMAKNLKAIDFTGLVHPIRLPCGMYRDAGSDDGLWLQVTRNGKKVWKFRGSFYGAKIKRSLGRFSQVTVEEARERAAEHTQQVRDKRQQVMLRGAMEYHEVSGPKSKRIAHHKPGVIYLMATSVDGVFKIGRTIDIKRRQKEHGLRLVGLCHTPTPIEHEAAVFRRLQPFRISNKGELFNIGESLAIAAIEAESQADFAREG